MAYTYRFTENEAPIGRELYVIPTGDWRTHSPVIDDAKCRRCGLCTLYCPVGCISKVVDSGDGKGRYVVDLKYCKGCGICVQECPSKAVYLVEGAGKE